MEFTTGLYRARNAQEVQIIHRHHGSLLSGYKLVDGKPDRSKYLTWEIRGGSWNYTGDLVELQTYPRGRQPELDLVELVEPDSVELRRRLR